MSDAEAKDAEVPWWQQAKAQSLERKTRAKSAAAQALAQPGDSFLIVTEGLVTERVYFELLKTDLKLGRAEVHVKPGDASDPKRVIETAARIARERRKKGGQRKLRFDQSNSFDHVWAIIDTDHATNQGIWKEVEGLARKLKVNLAHSTPCFEFWLLLHSSYSTKPYQSGDDAKQAVAGLLNSNYSTNRAIAEKAIARLIPEWPMAAERAERVRSHHDVAQTALPANPSTEVAKLVRALNDSLHEHQRREIAANG